MQGEPIKSEKVLFTDGSGTIIDTFQGLIQLKMFKKFLGKGFQNHFSNNDLLQQIFDYECDDLTVPKDGATKKKETRERQAQRRLCTAYKNSMIL